METVARYAEGFLRFTISDIFCLSALITRHSNQVFSEGKAAVSLSVMILSEKGI